MKARIQLGIHWLCRPQVVRLLLIGLTLALLLLATAPVAWANPCPDGASGGCGG
jgi:hypothetical protein